MQKMKIGLVQMGLKTSTDLEPAAIRDTMNEAHLPLIKQAAEQGVQVLCFPFVSAPALGSESMTTVHVSVAEP